MNADAYYNQCRIRHARDVGGEIHVTYECDGLPQPLEVFTPPFSPDFLDSGFEQFEWLVQFFTFGQPVRTDLREKTVEYGKDSLGERSGAPILTRGVGQIVMTTPGGNRDENELIVDIGVRGHLYVLAANRDIALKIGDWVELAPRHVSGLPDKPFMSVLDQAIHTIKIPKN
ncbi:MAG: hypothetical protein WC348_01375 [Patescibacteria group bacterium]|jgi:hypothetical protein